MPVYCRMSIIAASHILAPGHVAAHDAASEPAIMTRTPRARSMSSWVFSAWADHAVCYLEDRRKNPKAKEIRKYYELCWTSWAGQPEEAVMVDRVSKVVAWASM